jgi:hypothetical protein
VSLKLRLRLMITHNFSQIIDEASVHAKVVRLPTSLAWAALWLILPTAGLPSRSPERFNVH